MPITKSAAHHILSQRSLSPRTQQIADYWLSLWDQDKLPQRADINPSAIRSQLDGIALYEVCPDKGVRIVLAGTGYRRAFDRELTGQDWLSVTAPETRTLRLGIFSLVARGASIGFNRWPLTGFGDKAFACEKLLLPLRKDKEQNLTVLGFVDWHEIRGQQLDNCNPADLPPPAIFDAAPFLHATPRAITDFNKTDQRDSLHEESHATGHHKR